MTTIMRAMSALSCAVVVGWCNPAEAAIDIDGRSIPVVDMHLHPGHYGTMAPGGKAFIIESIPDIVRLYAPALMEAQLDPYRAFVGIAGQTEFAAVDHAVLYAVYTHHTTGFFTNSELQDVLTDPRNVAADGKPWAWGFASINLDDLDDDLGLESRFAALESYFVADPEHFIGIKLAHAHQQVAFDDVRHLGVYDVAARVGVPVLLHTGFSPFPNSQTEPEYYDPVHLESVVTSYADTAAAGRVDFVLSHAGQGDARAVTHALDLAAAHDNVWIEISALGRPLLIDENGQPVEDGDEQIAFVLGEIKRRQLIGRTLFGSDGPQFSGFVNSYLGKVVTAMQTAAYTTDEIEQVLSANFDTLFL